MKWQVPTLADVLEARLRISPYLRPTPLFGYPTLNELLDADVFIKHENHQQVGAFKVRGGHEGNRQSGRARQRLRARHGR
jgi:threonine dehydratase